MSTVSLCRPIQMDQDDSVFIDNEIMRQVSFPFGSVGRLAMNIELDSFIRSQSSIEKGPDIWVHGNTIINILYHKVDLQ